MNELYVTLMVGTALFLAGCFVGWNIKRLGRRKRRLPPSWEQRLTVLPICTYDLTEKSARTVAPPRVQSESPFERGLRLAVQHGFTLIKHSEYHYQLVRIDGPKWIYNLYPSTGKIVIDPHYKGPRINLKKHWTVADAVYAVIMAKETKTE